MRVAQGRRRLVAFVAMMADFRRRGDGPGAETLAFDSQSGNAAAAGSLRLTFNEREGGTMNKSDLIASVAEKAGLSRAQASGAVEAAIDAIVSSLKKGDDVRLVGFGTFQVVKRAAGVGRNLRTGETIKIPASKSPKFKAGQVLKDAVNK
ncbi:MAG TPA: HU family DNA-binding protein [Hyphomicrobiales bacterium]|nr:HU family DNA-binding protein [Hyphomicrobiales bacterium]